MNGLTTSPALSVHGLTKRYGDRVVLDGLDLEIQAGEVVSLLGANGSGKSTALRCIVGLQPYDGGVVQVDGAGLRSGQRSSRIAMVFQKIHLVPRLPVIDNVCAGALGRLPLKDSWAPIAFPRAIREEAMACLDRVGLADRAHDRAGSLSGGQQQRVAVARALCQRADILLADEPVSALDPAAAEQVMALLASLAHEDKMAVAAVLHQPDLARRHSDRLVGLLHGRMVMDATPATITNDEIDALYAPDIQAAAS